MNRSSPLTLETSVGTKLEALVAGRGLPVLALHGWLDNAMSFMPMMAHLERIELVCLDFPGHGKSDPRPPAVRYHFDDYVFDVLAAADALGWSKFHLLGHSLGGAVASMLAAASPERVLSLSAIEGLGPLTAPSDQTTSGWRRALKASHNRPRRVHAERADAIEARVQDSDLPRHAAEILAKRGLETVEGGWRWRHDQRLTWPSTQRYTEAHVLDLLSHIEAPTLCIMANPPSRVMPLGLLERRFAAVANSQMASWPGGHHLHMETPQPIAECIQEHIHEHHKHGSSLA
ncbi:MAG: alpha/beta hydrolase [Symploca sp. SIO2G7]|nr:alpha/beta hydrolase [Symploca sp. SIO2G7]